MNSQNVLLAVAVLIVAAAVGYYAINPGDTGFTVFRDLAETSHYTD